MSTSLLYHTQRIVDYQHVSFKFKVSQTIWKLKRKLFSLRCKNCGSKDVTERKINKERKILGLPIGQRQTVFIFDVLRIRCKDCSSDHQMDISIADPYKSYSKALGRYVIDLLRHMSIDAVAKHLGLGWRTVKSIQKIYLEKKYKNVPLNEVRKIGIDEIYVGKNKYFTIVLNMESGEVLFVGDGKSKESLQAFLKRLRKSKANIEVIAMDMGKSYRSWAEENFPNAIIVYDHFHVVKKMNEYVDKVRRNIQKNASEEENNYLKGKRWLLLKNRETLVKDDEKKLKELLEVNEPLAMTYQLKEQLRTIWDQDNKEDATKALENWCSLAEASNINELKKMTKTLKSYQEGILAYYDTNKLSSSKVEGFNNKIRWLIKIAYGWRDWPFFKLRIYHLPKSKVEMTG